MVDSDSEGEGTGTAPQCSRFPDSRAGASSTADAQPGSRSLGLPTSRVGAREGGGCTSQLNHFSWFILTRGSRVQVVRRPLFILFYCFNLTCGREEGRRLRSGGIKSPAPPSLNGRQGLVAQRPRCGNQEVGSGSATWAQGRRRSAVETLSGRARVRPRRLTENILKLC